jgi:hypothetical protein
MFAVMSDPTKIRQIMQYALLVAGQNDDPYNRQLGPIHLVKYVYLADMEYAKHHDGQTFTGIDWKFHHFGPWSTEVFSQIEAALVPFGAARRSFPSKFSDDDCIRWHIDFNEAAYGKLRNELPIEIKHAIPGYVQKYRDDTTSLLHFVYATRPMLHAAPGESLDFHVLVEPKADKGEEYIPYMARLSNTKRKKLKQGMDELRERFRQTMAERKPETYPVKSVGRMDAVFEEGVAWLDGLAGNPFPEEGATVHFSDEVWKSKARCGDV